MWKHNWKLKWEFVKTCHRIQGFELGFPCHSWAFVAYTI